MDLSAMLNNNIQTNFKIRVNIEREQTRLRLL